MLAIAVKGTTVLRVKLDQLTESQKAYYKQMLPESFKISGDEE